jgi:hypothetical protein
MLEKLLIICAAILLCVPARASAAQVSFFIGDVELLRNGKKSPVAVGNKLMTGDVIKTGKDSVMEVQDDNGGTIKILPMSTATIGSKKISGSDTLSLIAGDLSSAFTKLMKGSTKIYSPTTIAAVRGTEFTMDVSSGGDTRIDLSEGEVDVSNPYGKTIMRRRDKIESRVGEGPHSSSGTAEEWKKMSSRRFAQNPDAKADDTGRYLDTLSERGKDAGNSMVTVRSAVKDATSKESLKQAEYLLNSTEEKTVDDLYLNESIGHSLEYTMENFKDKDDALYSRFKSAYLKSNRVAEQHKKNLAALKKIREDYQKAYDNIAGRYKSKSEEIKSKFKDKKSGI